MIRAPSTGQLTLQPTLSRFLHSVFWWDSANFSLFRDLSWCCFILHRFKILGRMDTTDFAGQNTDWWLDWITVHGMLTPTGITNMGFAQLSVRTYYRLYSPTLSILVNIVHIFLISFHLSVTFFVQIINMELYKAARATASSFWDGGESFCSPSGWCIQDKWSPSLS